MKSNEATYEVIDATKIKTRVFLTKMQHKILSEIAEKMEVDVSELTRRAVHNWLVKYFPHPEQRKKAKKSRYFYDDENDW